jgi:hypothetical protein
VNNAKDRDKKRPRGVDLNKTPNLLKVKARRKRKTSKRNAINHEKEKKVNNPSQRRK